MEHGWFLTALIEFAAVIVGIIIFAKFCGWAKQFSLPGKVKTWTYILLGVGAVAFNWAYSVANKAHAEHGDTSMMGTLLLVSLAFVLFFSFVLMAQTKED
ncbi:MAG: hypothetical protein QHH05_01665 [Syntrophomonadaceae bacterium]|nr:hypothetical protein [Syntrophomonadaceae bacterium]MDH7497143.1 hypothetical protein [Syntrophomonadaceae bacterium]